MKAVIGVLPKRLSIVHVTNEDLVVNCRSEMPRLEVVNAVQICNVDTPAIQTNNNNVNTQLSCFLPPSLPYFIPSFLPYFLPSIHPSFLPYFLLHLLQSKDTLKKKRASTHLHLSLGI